MQLSKGFHHVGEFIDGRCLNPIEKNGDLPASHLSLPDCIYDDWSS